MARFVPLTSLKTQKEWVAHLQASFDRSKPFGGNMAIKRHLEKVRSMGKEAFEAHRAKQVKSSEAFQPTAKALAAELFAKQGR